VEQTLGHQEKKKITQMEGGKKQKNKKIIILDLWPFPGNKGKGEKNKIPPVPQQGKKLRHHKVTKKRSLAGGRSYKRGGIIFIVWC